MFLKRSKSMRANVLARSIDGVAKGSQYLSFESGPAFMDDWTAEIRARSVSVVEICALKKQIQGD